MKNEGEKEEGGSATPVVLLVFNRPELTARVLSGIRRAKPRRLYVVADGPRSHIAVDVGRCADVRRVIDEGVDWPCDVVKVYADLNLGCAVRVASGLDYVFEREEEAIILEDDCLPETTFFPFCEELLARYRTDKRVAHISGTPNYWSRIDRPESYLFSRYGSIWGWATWRRAWRTYDLLLKDWPALKAAGMLVTRGFGAREVRRREEILDEIHRGHVHTWDYQWSVAKWRHGWLSIVPVVPLIENIGMDKNGTHVPERGWVSPQVGRMGFPLTHPERVVEDEAFNEMWASRFTPSLLRRMVNRMRMYFPGGSKV